MGFYVKSTSSWAQNKIMIFKVQTLFLETEITRSWKKVCTCGLEKEVEET